MGYKNVVLQLDEIKIESPFKDLFTINLADLEAIKKDMDVDYDEAHPVVVWKQEMVLVDGHTRYQAASELKYKSIPAVLIPFKDEQDAIEYAIHNQLERRNLTDYDYIMLVEKIDKLSENWGGDRKSKDKKSSFSNEKLDTRDRTAKILGISKHKVSKCRYVLKRCSDQTFDAIRDGKITLHRAYANPPKIDIEIAAKMEKERKKVETAKKIDHELLFKYTDKLTAKKGKKRTSEQNYYYNQLFYLFNNMFPQLMRSHVVVENIKQKLQWFKEKDILEGVTEQPMLREFLESQFISDFFTILHLLGYRYEYRKDGPNPFIEEDAPCPFGKKIIEKGLEQEDEKKSWASQYMIPKKPVKKPLK